MPSPHAVIKITGVEAVARAFRELGPKLARRVIVSAEKKALMAPKEMVRSLWPVRTGKSRKSIRVRASKGPRGWKKGNISLALLVGESGRKGDKQAGVKRPWWAFLIEHGFHTGGKRIRKAGKTVGYKQMRKGVQVREIPGKHIMRRALRSTEAAVKSRMTAEILKGIEEIASKA
jgi:hypothetical protein